MTNDPVAIARGSDTMLHVLSVVSNFFSKAEDIQS